MNKEVEWRLWLKEKEEIEKTIELISDLMFRLGELSQASNPYGLEDAMFERLEYGQNNVDRMKLDEDLFNLRENIEAGIKDHEEYLKECFGK